ncbi:MAG: replicative DNA helicase [Oscillospiraceae bacterium]|jgi:replicative DNA helicase|nr:replicative DNA helicase [Oscillospiraceae bacterium]
MDDLLNRQIPHSTEAEQAVLGSMLIDSRCVGDVVGVLRAADFYSTINRNIFETIFSMFSFAKPIDPVTVLERMREDGVWTDDTPGYIRDLMLITPTAANAIEYAWIVKDKALLRGIADAGDDITQMAISGEDGALNILEAAEKKVYSLRQDRSRAALEKISEIMVDVYKSISDAAKADIGIPGLTTGFHDLDRIIMGLNDSDLILIASRPGMGKTSIALNIALHVARKSGKSVAVFSLEMSREQLAMRLLSSSAFIDGKRLHTGRLTDAEWHRLAEAAKHVSDADLLINDDASLTVIEMNAQCRRLSNLGLVVIDYMQLMSAATNERGYRGENRVQIVTEISRTMKVMAKELNVPIICLSQLNRDNEKRPKNDRRPQLSDLRESGSIEQDADIVMGLYRDDYYNEESEIPNIAECIILKNRRGETGTVQLRWDPEYTNFSQLDRYHDE